MDELNDQTGSVRPDPAWEQSLPLTPQEPDWLEEDERLAQSRQAASVQDDRGGRKARFGMGRKAAGSRSPGVRADLKADQRADLSTDGLNVPLKDGSQRRGAGKLLLVFLLVVLALLGGGGWFWLHGKSSPGGGKHKGLGMAQVEAALAPVEESSAPASVLDAASTPVDAGGSVNSPALAQGKQDDGLGALPQGASGATSLEAVSESGMGTGAGLSGGEATLARGPDGGLPLAQPTVDAAGAGALAVPASGAALAAVPGDASAPPSGDTLESLREQVRQLQGAVLALQASRREGSEAGAGNVGGAGLTRHERSAVQAHPARRRVAAASAAAAEAPPPALGAQLMSVDLWGGSPSVVVTTGLPGDTRTRTLRPGDTLNGVTLQSANPATGQATFSSGGKVFTLSVGNGG